MPSNISSKATVAKNTAFLYIRTLVVMLVTLYTSRIILQALGVEDYGIFTAIGGVISFMAIITGPIDGAISRFMTYELGRGDYDKLKRYFSTGIAIMLIFALIAVVIFETAGLWFLNEKMVLSEDRRSAARWVLHLIIVSFVISLIASPYRAAIISHEKMNIYAFLSILDAMLKLGVAIVIKYTTKDALILYAIMLLMVSIIIRACYTIVCRSQFEECKHVKVKIDKELFNELFSFAGWNMFGSASFFCRGQGLNILLNLFGGAAVNAAYGVANQASAAVNSLVVNFTTALNPSIIKSYASAETNYMMSLVYQGAKFTFFLVLLFSIPLILEADYVTHLWLGQVPDFAVPFIQLMLVYSLVDSFSKTIMSGVNATGRVRAYQVVIGLFMVLVLPIAYVILKLEYSPIWVFAAVVVVDVFATFVRLMMARKIFGLSVRKFIRDVILRTIIVALIAVPIPLLIHQAMNQGFLRFVLLLITSLTVTLFSVLFVGCTKTERYSVIEKAKQAIHRKK